MIDRNHKLSLVQQAEALAISRGSVYYQPRPVSEANLALMRLIDKLHLDYPFAGSRMLRDLLNLRGIRVGRRRVGRLMRLMGIEALYRKPNTSRKHPEHKIYPYLLRHLTIERPNQVWAMDITYIPMARGFVYLAAVIDWYSRKVLSWRVSITMDVQFCLDTVQEAIDHHGTPDIFNTD
jgi:putative transposase